MRKQKNSVTSKIKSLKGELAQRKTDQKEILLERIRDKEHAEVYDEMLESCESDIKKIKTEIYEIENYDDTIRKRKAELKNTLEIMEEIVAEGAVSNSNLRQLIDKIVIYETADGLDIRIRIQANFTTHMKIYDG